MCSIQLIPGGEISLPYLDEHTPGYLQLKVEGGSGEYDWFSSERTVGVVEPVHSSSPTVHVSGMYSRRCSLRACGVVCGC